MITIDFETRSECDLKKCGTSVYARHPSTSVLCLAYQIDGYPVRLWKPGDPKPYKLLDLVERGERKFEAHNVFFERNIWRHICNAKMGWPDIKFENWRCSMAACSRMTLPRSLGGAGAALGLSIAKDDAGHKVMMRLSKPKRPSQADPGIWDNDPEKFAKLYSYCEQDVRSEVAISQAVEPLPKSELALWQLDQRINLRGLAVDRDAIEHSLAIVDQTKANCNARIAELTDGQIQTTGQVKAIIEWVKDKTGETLPNLAKATVEEYLADPEHDLTRQILELRAEASKSSTSKLSAMLSRCDEDGRVRGNLVYHGAATGRWAGSGIQIQNYTRGNLKPYEIEAVYDLLPRRSGRALDLTLGNPIDCISSCLRSMVRAGEGNRFLVCDFASIEARVLAWIAGQEDQVAAFAANADVYVDMAAKIYDVETSEVTKSQRHIGKTSVLGCFTEDTLVLTDEGWKRIVEVETSNLVWDGEQWVRHSGIIYQGKKNVLRQAGVGATLDHLCLTPNGWRPWGLVATNLRSLRKATRSVSLPSGVFAVPSTAKDGAGGTYTKLNVHAGTFNARSERMLTGADQRGVTVARRSHRAQNDTGSTKTQWTTMSTERGCSTVCHQRSEGAINRITLLSKDTAGEGYTSFESGEIQDRSFSNTFRRLTGGTTRRLRWTGSTTTKGTNRETSVSLQEKRTCPTEEQSRNYSKESPNWNQKSDVYDIAYAGPNNRFTIWTEEGPLVVHNCGYGMGHRAFVDTCKRMAGVEIDLSFSKKVIKTYREANDKIKDLWGQTGTAAIKAIETRETQKVGRLVFTFDGDWLRIKIPSGRCLHYRSPKIIEVRAPWSEGYTGTIYGPSSLAKEIEAKGIELGSDHIVKGDKQGWVECDVPKAARSWLRSKGIECRLQMKEPQYIKQITFWGVDSQTKKWSRQRTYGAKLVENLCQGIARDFLAEAMFRCENAGYPIVATIHDEILCERPIGEGSLDEFETLMKAIPSWGKGCPIEVEGFEAGRYRK